MKSQLEKLFDACNVVQYTALATIKQVSTMEFVGKDRFGTVTAWHIAKSCYVSIAKNGETHYWVMTH